MWKNRLTIKIGVPRDGVEGVSAMVAVQVLRRGLRQQPVDALPLRQHRQRAVVGVREELDRVGRVHSGEKAAGAAAAARPEGLEQAVTDQA